LKEVEVDYYQDKHALAITTGNFEREITHHEAVLMETYDAA